MQFFLDSANIKEIKEAARMGIIRGVTTNPTLVSNEGKADYRSVITDIAGVISGPISVEVVTENPAEMIAQAREMAIWAPNVVVKIPLTAAGLSITSTLVKEGIKVNMTLCFSLNQALLAGAVGATYVSPFIGRLDDIGEDGIQLVADIVDVYNNYGIPTQVIAASIRHTQHCFLAAKAGASIATVPYKILLQMVNHPLTEAGQARFLADWKKIATPKP
jgi:transaldolase